MPDPDKLDAAQTGGQDTPEEAFPGGGKSDFRVYIAPEVHQQIWRHAEEDTTVEVGGVLVGDWRHDGDGPFVRVSEFIRCDAAASRSGEVTFTHQAWNDILRQMDTRFSDLAIVGWYHTHPRFGIFLSDRDRFIHEHFFSNPGQIALVVDPVAKTEGVFAWQRGRPELTSHYWVGSRVLAGREQTREAEPVAKAAAEPDRPPFPALSAIRQALVYFSVFMIGFLLAGLLRDPLEQRLLQEGAVAHYGVWKGLRPGLREELDKAQVALEAVSGAAGALAKDDLEGAEVEAADRKARWDEFQGAVIRIRRHLRAVSQRYALTPQESAVVSQIIAQKEAELQGVKTPPAEEDAQKPEPSAEKGKKENP